MENAIKFDDEIALHHFSQSNLEFKIIDIPLDTKKVRTPITYLKGFVVRDDEGNKLKSYKDKEVFLTISPSKTTKNIIIQYEKTLLHKISILISIISWIALSLGIFFKKGKLIS
ncbi:MAG: hypothetical protein ACK5LM_02655 [Lactovum sp.]